MVGLIEPILVETEGADYRISAQWDSQEEAIKVNLGINARDWKKPSNLKETIFCKNGFPFVFTVSKILGLEEHWTDENEIKVDYSSVHLVLRAGPVDGKEPCINIIDTSGKFEHDLNFYIKPENGKSLN